MDSSKPEDLTSLCSASGSPVVTRACAGDLAHEFRVACRKPVRLDAQIVFKPGSAMSACLQAPLIDFPLMTADSGGNPCGVG